MARGTDPAPVGRGGEALEQVRGQIRLAPGGNLFGGFLEISAAAKMLRQARLLLLDAGLGDDAFNQGDDLFCCQVVDELRLALGEAGGV